MNSDHTQNPSEHIFLGTINVALQSFDELDKFFLSRTQRAKKEILRAFPSFAKTKTGKKWINQAEETMNQILTPIIAVVQFSINYTQNMSYLTTEYTQRNRDSMLQAIPIMKQIETPLWFLPEETRISIVKKSKALETPKDFQDAFSDNPDLGMMAYQGIKAIKHLHDFAKHEIYGHPYASHPDFAGKNHAEFYNHPQAPRAKALHALDKMKCFLKRAFPENIPSMGQRLAAAQRKHAETTTPVLTTGKPVTK